MDEIVNMQRCRFSRLVHNKGILECNLVRKQIHICFTRFLFLGIFFVLPCIETYQKVDLRTITLDVPPQEVIINQQHIFSVQNPFHIPGSNARLSDGVSGRSGVLSGVERDDFGRKC